MAADEGFDLSSIANLPDEELIEGQRSLILDPNDPHVIDEALKNGIPPAVVESAQNSPVYKYVIDWKIALPPHIDQALGRQLHIPGEYQDRPRSHKK